jgi:hypothetical protein
MISFPQTKIPSLFREGFGRGVADALPAVEKAQKKPSFFSL